MNQRVDDTWTIIKPLVRTSGGLVASQHRDAAAVGAEVLGAGGNAADAAIATSLALAALEPWMSGLGGGGFMVIARTDGTAEVIDFAMRAPAALDPAAYALSGGQDDDMFGWPMVVDERNIHGPLAIAAPGQAGGLALAHHHHATMPWADLCRPAIDLARRGVPVTWHTSLKIANAARELVRYETAREVYLPEGLPPIATGDGTPGRLSLGRLVATLDRLADAGPLDLVEGELARALVADVRATGGVLAIEDLASNPARRVAPLRLDLGAATILAAPGLSAGPTLGHAVSLLNGRVATGLPGPSTYTLWAEALFTAYEHRLATLGEESSEPTCTTHLAVVDTEGTMVSLTQTLLSAFGSKVLSPATGILLNNGVMWFDPRPGRTNSVAPGKRPLSNMCPVIAQRGGVPWFALGASGGRHILPAVLQIGSMMIEGGLDLETAFHTPRIDVSGGPTLLADESLATEVLAALEARFPVRQVQHQVSPNLFACPTAVLRDPASGEAQGMTDPFQPVAGVAVQS